MQNLALQGYGGQIYYIDGAGKRIVNLTFNANIADTTPEGVVSAVRSSNTQYNLYHFGGKNSYFPSSYANHKPLAFYKINFIWH